jgi:NTP pyrophosphatase (non-canonical NTP hydrolase)
MKRPRLRPATESDKPSKFYGDDGWMVKYLRGETYELRQAITSHVKNNDAYKWNRRFRRLAS